MQSICLLEGNERREKVEFYFRKSFNKPLSLRNPSSWRLCKSTASTPLPPYPSTAPLLCKSITSPRVTAIYNEFGIAQNLHKFFANVSCQSCHTEQQKERVREGDFYCHLRTTFFISFVCVWVLQNMQIKLKLRFACHSMCTDLGAGLSSVQGWGLTGKLCFCKNCCYRFLCRVEQANFAAICTIQCCRLNWNRSAGLEIFC